MSHTVLFESYGEEAFIREYENRTDAFSAASSFAADKTVVSPEARVVGPDFIVIYKGHGHQVIWAS